jgi:hypothetical protein
VHGAAFFVYVDSLNDPFIFTLPALWRESMAMIGLEATSRVALPAGQRCDTPCRTAVYDLGLANLLGERMTFDKHVRLVMDAELGTVLRRGFTEGIDATGPPPQLLWVLADGQQLRDAVVEGAWPAPDARFAGEAALDAYALPLLHAFIDERRGRQPDTPQRRFGDELMRGIHPVGSYFERYLVRMFDGVGAALEREQGRMPYALGLRTEGLDMAAPAGPGRRTFEVSSAIYDASIQRGILEAIYTAFETWHAQAGERFGHRAAEQVLASCWDAFRHAVGAVLPRFRPPHLAAEREWIANARWRNPAGFGLAGDMLVPALSLRAHSPAARGLPVERALLHAGLPQPLAADSLRQFCRFHKLPARVAVAPSNITFEK